MQFIKNTLIHYFPVLGTIKREALTLEQGGEMWRIGRGYNNDRPFFRIDWGTKGWRWTWGIDHYSEYHAIYSKLPPNLKMQCDVQLEKLVNAGKNSPKWIEHIVVTRSGQMIRERRDLWKRMYDFVVHADNFG